jgi:hypothetical protein
VKEGTREWIIRGWLAAVALVAVWTVFGEDIAGLFGQASQPQAATLESVK